MNEPAGKQVVALMSAARVLQAWQAAPGSGEDELGVAIAKERADELLLGLISLSRILSIDVAVLTGTPQEEVIPAAIARVLGMDGPLGA